MPFISIKMIEGRTKEQKEKLIKSVSAAVSQSLGIDINKVWIVIEDYPADEWGLGGMPASEKLKK